jgi:hypothetical protein
VTGITVSYFSLMGGAALTQPTSSCSLAAAGPVVGDRRFECLRPLAVVGRCAGAAAGEQQAQAQ